MNEFEEIKQQAKKELDEERLRSIVDAYKRMLRSKKHWFPWRIKIINLNKEFENEC